MGDAGKILVAIGGVIVIVGLVLLALGRLNIPVGRLPGDIAYRGKNVSVYFPLGTSILISVILSLVFYFFSRLRR
ncbi:MAG: DUF2905 domain-containing protein [Acidobacteria bacterium]|nr:DUF2905 domain-containing protein [Acidobacteriota bacterium]